MRRNIGGLFGFFVLAFLLVSVALLYWQVIRAPTLLAREDNPRPVEEAKKVTRGRILDRTGQELARSLMSRSSTPGHQAGYVKRFYSYPPLSPVIGYWSSRYGPAGIEAAEDGHLSGRARANPQELWDRFLHRPQVGDDVVLTVDLALQKVVEAALGKGSGAAVVLNPRTGAILAMASHPYFDANNIESDWEKIKADPARPLLNRATQGLYPPGSTFKTVTLAAALEQGVVTATTPFSYTLLPPGGVHKVAWHQNDYVSCENHPGKSSFDLSGAYAWSCNVAFSEIGLKMGPDTYLEYARRFGLEEALPLEIPTEVSRAYRRPDYFFGQERFYALASTAFGQGELAITPLQMALISAAIANNGAMPRPHLVNRVQSREGQVLATTVPRIWRISVSPAAASQAKAIMVYSVDSGWASKAQIKGVKVGGKTGTAESGDFKARPHSWFIGFAPAEDPRLAIAVIKEFAGYGSEEAAPAAKKIMEAALALPGD
ncbi:MAG: penicillin-binding protein 2 [Chloroflexota bacterium]